MPLLFCSIFSNVLIIRVIYILYLLQNKASDFFISLCLGPHDKNVSDWRIGDPVETEQMQSAAIYSYDTPLMGILQYVRAKFRNCYILKIET